MKNTKAKRIFSGIEHQVWAKLIATRIVETNNLTQIEEKALLFEIVENSLIDEPNLILKFIKMPLVSCDNMEVNNNITRN